MTVYIILDQSKVLLVTLIYHNVCAKTALYSMLYDFPLFVSSKLGSIFRRWVVEYVHMVKVKHYLALSCSTELASFSWIQVEKYLLCSYFPVNVFRADRTVFFIDVVRYFNPTSLN